jgi:hypothetical protein
MHIQLTTWEKNANIKNLPHPPITFLMVRPLRDSFLNYFNFGIGNIGPLHASGISRLWLTYKNYLFNELLNLKLYKRAKLNGSTSFKLSN